jgi:AAA family ATP:ADP antiporter
MPIRIGKPWRGERGPVSAAAATLLVVMAGHAMRETARDTLFLTHLPVVRLPWAYLAIAALTLAGAAVARRRFARVSHRLLLASSLLVAAAVDLAFWWIARTGVADAVFALYVWTGLVSTAVTVLFWLHLADRFDVGEAKRSFAIVAAGGLAGAVCGSAGAALLLRSADTRALLVGSSALSAAAAAFVMRAPTRARIGDAPSGGPTDWSALLRDAYLGRIVAVSALVAVLGTGVDFVFKSAVATEVPRAALGSFFARFNTGMNASALLFQMVVAPPLLQAIGVTRAVAVLPAALLLGSAAVAAAPGLAPLVLLKGADGTFRHSLYRAGSEILYLPLPPQARSAFKTLADGVGQRGGQALASLGILAAVALHATPRALALALLAVSALALAPLAGLRRPYVARFRDQIRSLNPAARRSVPRLELHSLEVLVSSLSSPDATEVLSALDLLEAYGKTALVSPLILHHPSSAVVLRALELLAGSDHPHVGPLIEGLLAHRDPAVRAAALHHHAARAPADPRLLRVLREDASFAVRATALLLWIGPRNDPDTIQRLVREILDSGEREARLALARALPSLPTAPIEALRALVADPEPAYAAEIAQAASAAPRLEHVPMLLELLARREARPTARAALVALGEPALRALAASLADGDAPDAIRRHVPRAVARFATAEAAAILVRATGDRDARIRSRALRGLARMRANAPALPVDAEALSHLAEGSLRRAVTLLHYAAVHAAWSDLHPLASNEDDQLGPLLTELERRALEQVFRALHVLEPEHEYAAIFEALRQGGRARAGSREILEHLVEGPMRQGLLALLGPYEPRERLRLALDFHQPDGADPLLDLLPAAADARALSDERRSRLERVCLSVFPAIERDPDPILASVARHWLRTASPRPEPAELRHVG